MYAVAMTPTNVPVCETEREGLEFSYGEGTKRRILTTGLMSVPNKVPNASAIAAVNW